jgi:hypothetical protein
MCCLAALYRRLSRVGSLPGATEKKCQQFRIAALGIGPNSELLLLQTSDVLLMQESMVSTGTRFQHSDFGRNKEDGERHVAEGGGGGMELSDQVEGEAQVTARMPGAGGTRGAARMRTATLAVGKDEARDSIQLEARAGAKAAAKANSLGASLLNSIAILDQHTISHEIKRVVALKKTQDGFLQLSIMQQRRKGKGGGGVLEARSMEGHLVGAVWAEVEAADADADARVGMVVGGGVVAAADFRIWNESSDAAAVVAVS